jgi:hypothetical protein
MTAPESASRKPKQLDAGGFQPEISSFRLHLAAEGKAAKSPSRFSVTMIWRVSSAPARAARSRSAATPP